MDRRTFTFDDYRDLLCVLPQSCLEIRYLKPFMLTKHAWVNYASCCREQISQSEVIVSDRGLSLIRGVVSVEQDGSLFISFAFTKEFPIKYLISIIKRFKSKYGHLKWQANVYKDSLICRNFAKRLGFVEKSDIILEDSNLIFIEREPD